MSTARLINGHDGMNVIGHNDKQGYNYVWVVLLDIG